MRRQAIFVAILLTALIGAGCATPAPYNPFKVAQSEFYREIKTIALAPVFGGPERVRPEFSSLIEIKLREAGFSVVPARESEQIWKRMTERVGGVFDPVTGKRDEAKFKTVREHTLRELNAKFKADALLHPRVVVVPARFAAGTATWDGTSEPVLPPGFLAALVGGSAGGTVNGLSLLVSIENVHGVTLYINRGGIQLLAKLSRGRFVPIPENELFTNAERNMGAVNIALGPLVTKTAQKPPPARLP